MFDPRLVATDSLLGTNKPTAKASEEAQALAMFREMGLDIVPDDPLTIARGEAKLKELIDENVRSALAKAMANVVVQE